MPDLKTDAKDFQEIPIEAVIGPIEKADKILEKGQKLLSNEVKKAFPKGTLVQYGQQKYKVKYHGFHWSRPAEITLKNVKTHAEIDIDVTLDKDLEKLTIIKYPEQ